MAAPLGRGVNEGIAQKMQKEWGKHSVCVSIGIAGSKPTGFLSSTLEC